MKAYEVAGTSSATNHDVIKNNLKIVSLICNVFTTAMCLFLVYKLSKYLNRSKSNAMQRKIPLLKWSIGFIICFFINTILLVFVPFVPNAYPICDLLMQVVIMVTVLVFFKHWETSLELFIMNRYTLMLNVKSASNRLTFMARVMNQASK